MANKKTISQLERELDRYHRQLNYIVRQISERRDLIKKIRLGKVKQPAPPGKKVMLKRAMPEVLADLNDKIPFGGGDDDSTFGG
jgi:hypothetical protein